MSEALRLADAMLNYWDERGPDAEAVAAELRRLHADVKALREENAELRVWFGSEAQRSGLLQRKLNAAEAENDALQKANRLLQQHHATAWNRGHTMGMHANETIAKQALDAVKKDAWGNTQLTEALMAAEAENEALRAALKEAASYTRHPDYDWPVEFSRRVDAAIDAARSKT